MKFSSQRPSDCALWALQIARVLLGLGFAQSQLEPLLLPCEGSCRGVFWKPAYGLKALEWLGGWQRAPGPGCLLRGIIGTSRGLWLGTVKRVGAVTVRVGAGRSIWARHLRGKILYSVAPLKRARKKSSGKSSFPTKAAFILARVASESSCPVSASARTDSRAEDRAR